MTSGPYRGGPTSRWICIVCYRHVSAFAGLCPRCGVDLLSLDDAQVRGELRAEAERRMQKRMYGEYFALSLLGFVLAMPILPIVGSMFYVGAALGAGWLSVRAWSHLRPRSALALYAERRERLAAELAGSTVQRALPAHEAKDAKDALEDGDPEGLDLEATLRWLGLREVEEKR